MPRKYNKNQFPCVYLLNEPNTSFYKIGHTKQIARRIDDLSTGRAVLLVATDVVHLSDIATAIQVEKRLHRFLWPYHVRGEWYQINDLRLWHVALGRSGACRLPIDKDEPLAPKPRLPKPIPPDEKRYLTMEQLSIYKLPPLAIIPHPKTRPFQWCYNKENPPH